MIEETVIDYLSAQLEIPAFAEKPESPPDKYIVVSKVGARIKNHIRVAILAVQSHGQTLYDAARLSMAVVDAMPGLLNIDYISRVQLNTEHNHTDPRKKEYRYQAVFEITYHKEG